jgi:uncharacterized protein (TIGR02284 family)
MNDIDTITLLNRLIVTSKNGESALRAAAAEAHHSELKQSLTEYSDFFGDAAREMQKVVYQIGGHPKTLATFGNTLHRTLMHLTALVDGRNEKQLLDSVERDERAADLLFEDAVTHWDTPPEIHAMLERQRDGARQRHEAMRLMRERLDTLH